MKLPRRRFLSLAASAMGLAAGSRIASAEPYPARPVRLIVQTPAGGSPDMIARITAQWLSERLGQPFVVENRSGASGNIATEAVLRAPADGYSLLLAMSANAINASVSDDLHFNFIKDAEPVASIGKIPLVMEVNPSVPAKTVPQFIAYAKANPGKVRYASVGVGSNNHYDTEAFAQWAGIKLYHVPNKGGGGAITNDVLRGDVHVVLVNAASSAGLAKSGMIRVLAVMADNRLPEYPDVPTFKELGYTAGEGLWSALYAPARTPRDVLEALFRMTVQALKSEVLQTTFKQQMIKAVPNASIEEAQAWSKAETARWRKLTEEVNIERPQ